MARVLALLLLALLAPTTPLDVGAQQGAGHHPVAAIRAAVVAAVPDAGAPGTTVEALVDDRLRLPACPQALQAAPARPGTIEVRCAAPAWRLYVPVRVRRSVPVLVVRQPVAPGAPVPAEALAVETREVAGLASPGLSDPAQAVGQLARRLLVPGTVLTARDLAAAPVIRRGDAVALIARAGGIEVRAEGRALGDAAPGDRVNVENLATRRIVQARARGAGEVEVTAR
ncbi:MAG: flagellar basal body P-ring formation chaperone FlgA [Pseudomonadota bacterium]